MQGNVKFRILEESAKNGSDRGQIDLAKLYFDNGNFEKAYYWLCQAKSKNLFAVVQSSQMLYNGQGVKQDKIKAAKQLEECAKKGLKDALFILGNLYLDDKNYNDAIKTYNKIKEMPQALFNLASIYHTVDEYKDIKKAINYYLQAYNKGVADAAYNLGSIYFFGEIDSKPNYAKALEYYTDAYKAGFEDAKKFIDVCKENIGESVYSSDIFTASDNNLTGTR